MKVTAASAMDQQQQHVFAENFLPQKAEYGLRIINNQNLSSFRQPVLDRHTKLAKFAKARGKGRHRYEYDKSYMRVQSSDLL